MRGAHLFCPNRLAAPQRLVGRMAHFASRDAMDIEFFSEMTASQLHQELGVRDPADLYTLQLDDLVKLDRFGEKKARNLLSALDKSKPVISRPSCMPLAYRTQARPRPKCLQTTIAVLLASWNPQLKSSSRFLM